MKPYPHIVSGTIRPALVKLTSVTHQCLSSVLSPANHLTCIQKTRFTERFISVWFGDWGVAHFAHGWGDESIVIGRRKWGAGLRINALCVHTKM